MLTLTILVLRASLANQHSVLGKSILRRFHLFEIHDFPWCPKFIRDSLTDFLEVSMDVLDTYGPVRTRLLDFLARSKASCVVDLCSGAGGPWPHWLAKGQVSAHVTLTDRFPNAHALQRVHQMHIDGLCYRGGPVDAMAVPSGLQGLRTMFSAFHHFEPIRAAAIVKDAVSNRQPIAICEVTDRSPRSLLLALLTPLGVWLLTPRMKNKNWAKLLFTYLLPVIPLVITFDALVSCLRTYTVAELESFGNAPDYVWIIGSEKGPGMPVTYMMGFPREA